MGSAAELSQHCREEAGMESQIDRFWDDGEESADELEVDELEVSGDENDELGDAADEKPIPN
jgi:hypothetical protein